LLGNFTVNSVFPYECLKKGEGAAKVNLKKGEGAAKVNLKCGVVFVLRREKSDALVKLK